ncbi:ATP-binding protein [Falsiroseomonas tokyonensis]|uniref:histidine kinase n=1 Tax=Falsiroseomonas tokyonensis TaxID=430521 RepID=A0ABV7BYB3_9PROT|nr:ATP-binding protein [Falsiroseomonas tokyonensis]MBU8539408.1 PAS domain-containing protein [Falsiroseomonas tokyonensis]
MPTLPDYEDSRGGRQPAPDPAAPSDTLLDQALQRIARLACNSLGVARAGICQAASATAPPQDDPAGFALDTPLLGRDGTRLGTLWLRHDGPRAALGAAEQAVLADLAATAVEALERHAEFLALAWREQLLRVVADAPSFAVAVDKAMAAVREATCGMLCLFFRLAPDGVHMQLVAGQASTPALTEAYLSHLRQIDVRIDNSLIGQVAVSGEQQVITHIDDAMQRRYPAISLSVSQRIGAQVVTPVSVGGERYAFSIGFASDDRDMAALAERMRALAGTLRPLLRRLRDAEEIALNEQRFRLVARATAEIVWDLDLAIDRLWLGEEFREQFGHALPDPPPGLGWWAALVASEDRDRVLASRQAAIAAGRPWREEYRLRRADGSLALVLDRGFLIQDAEGAALRMVGSMVDITRPRAMEEQLRQSQRLDALGNLTGGVAHDFNNLLAVIIGNVELMAEATVQDPALRGFLEVILAAAERGAALTARLLTFARLHPLAPKALDVNRLLREVEALVRPLIGAGIQLAFLPCRGPAPVVIDGPQLENAVLNLCINARDAMPEGGLLRIETDRISASALAAAQADVPLGDYVTITVSDTGTGMPPEVAERAFEPFFTTKAFGKGSGLGLSMVFGFVGQSQGHVRIRTAPGRGTAVTLYLPQAAAVPEPEEAEAPPIALEGGRGRVLLVEDDATLRRTGRAQLQRLGYQVLLAEDGEAAMALLQGGAPVDLLFTDIVMPGRLNGHQLARQAMVLRPRLRVLFTSGYQEGVAPEPGDLEQGFLLLPKPYRLADLARAISRLMDAAPGASGSE